MNCHLLTLPPAYASVKPDPPEGVRQSPLPGQQLWVQWKPPRSWPFPEIFSLKYWIRYKRHGASRFRQVRRMRAGRVEERAHAEVHWGRDAGLRHEGGPSSSASGHLPGRTEIKVSNKYCYTDVHSSAAHSSLQMETTKVAINR